MAWKRGKKKKDDSAPKPKAEKKEFVAHEVSPEELLPNGTELLTLTLSGRPATKKTHQNIVYVGGAPRILPSKQYLAYEKSVKQACLDAWKNQGKQAMDFGMGIHMRIFLDKWTVGDHTGYMQSLGDILQKWEIIADDSWISWVSTDEHWLGGVDKDNPRVELTITRVIHPKEAYRVDKEATEEKAKIRRETKAAKDAGA